MASWSDHNETPRRWYVALQRWFEKSIYDENSTLYGWLIIIGVVLFAITIWEAW